MQAWQQPCVADAGGVNAMPMKRGKRLIACAVGALLAAATVAHAAGDADAGKKIFNKCMACHRIGPDAKNLIGPVLTGVIGRTAGTIEGFAYSTTMRNAGAQGLVWTEDAIKAYLPDPDAFLKKFLTDKGKPDLIADKTKMTFKLAPEIDPADIIAYLATFPK